MLSHWIYCSLLRLNSFTDGASFYTLTLLKNSYIDGATNFFLLVRNLKDIYISPLTNFEGAGWVPAAPAPFYTLTLQNKLLHRWRYKISIDFFFGFLQVQHNMITVGEGFQVWHTFAFGYRTRTRPWHPLTPLWHPWIIYIWIKNIFFILESLSYPYMNQLCFSSLASN